MKRLRGDAGQVGGIEAVPFGLLVLLVGVLVLAHTWAVVDAKFITAGTAREATRAFVEAADEVEADAAVDGLSGQRTFARCRPARFVARMEVPAFGLPWRPARPTVTVRSAHQELVDPYRDGLPGVADCDGRP